MTPRLPPRTRAYWACQGIGWGLYVVFTAWQTHRQLHEGGRWLVEPLLAAALGIALTHLYRHYARTKNWLALGGGAIALRVALGSAILSVSFVLLLFVVELGFYGDRPSSILLTIFGAIVRWTLVYLVWAALYFGLGAVRRRQVLEILALRLEKERQAAELRALEAQMNPHFLFNALNSIRALISEEPSRAQDAVTELSRMLRYTLRTTEDVVTLDRELETVDDYLALEALRLGSRLVVERDITEAARFAQVPIMLVLTLVDNAIKHGISQLPAGGTLRLRARVDGESLSIDVEQPRPRTPSTLCDGRGIGIANVRARLGLLYGDRASFSLDLPDGAAHAHVELPVSR